MANGQVSWVTMIKVVLTQITISQCQNYCCENYHCKLSGARQVRLLWSWGNPKGGYLRCHEGKDDAYVSNNCFGHQKGCFQSLVDYLSHPHHDGDGNDVMMLLTTISKHVIPKEGGFEPQIDGVILPPSQPAPLDPRQNEVIVALSPSTSSPTLSPPTSQSHSPPSYYNAVLWYIICS